MHIPCHSTTGSVPKLEGTEQIDTYRRYWIGVCPRIDPEWGLSPDRGAEGIRANLENRLLAQHAGTEGTSGQSDNQLKPDARHHTGQLNIRTEIIALLQRGLSPVDNTGSVPKLEGTEQIDTYRRYRNGVCPASAPRVRSP